MPEAAQPDPMLGLLEGPRFIGELAALMAAAPWLATLPPADGHAVLVLPGFRHDNSITAPFRQFLDLRGHRTRGWQHGTNLGLRDSGGAEGIVPQLESMYAHGDAPVSIVGFGLGGVFARRLARLAPQCVRQVISIGAPITGDPRQATSAVDYQAVTGVVMDERFVKRFREREDRPLPVPATSIFSRSDGVVAWETARETAGEHAENIEVVASHAGLHVNPAVFYAAADRLALPVNGWKLFDFDRSSVHRMMYPNQITRVATTPIAEARQSTRVAPSVSQL